MSEAILQNILNTFDQYYERKQQNKVNKERQANADRDFTQKKTEFEQQQKNRNLEMQLQASQVKISQNLQQMDMVRKEQEYLNTTGSLSPNMTKVRDTFSGPEPVRVQDPSNPENSALINAVLPNFKQERTGMVARNNVFGTESTFVDPEINAQKSAGIQEIRDLPAIKRIEATKIADADRQISVDNNREDIKIASDDRLFKQQNNQAELRRRYDRDQAQLDRAASADRLTAQIAGMEARSAAGNASMLAVANLRLDAAEKKAAYTESKIPPVLQKDLTGLKSLQTALEHAQKILNDPTGVATADDLKALFPEDGYTAETKLWWNDFQKSRKWDRGKGVPNLEVLFALLSKTAIKDTYGVSVTSGESTRLEKWAVEPGKDTNDRVRSKVAEGLKDVQRMMEDRLSGLNPRQLEALMQRASRSQKPEDSTAKGSKNMVQVP